MNTLDCRYCCQPLQRTLDQHGYNSSTTPSGEFRDAHPICIVAAKLVAIETAVASYPIQDALQRVRYDLPMLVSHARDTAERLKKIGVVWMDDTSEKSGP